MHELQRVDVNLLVSLAALLDQRNVTHAAESVGMSQPAMSGVLSRLRKLLDDDLLVREGRGFELTPLAESLRPTVQEAIAQVDRTLSISHVFDPQASRRTFRVAISDYASHKVWPSLERLLGAAAPNIRLEFLPLPSEVGEWESQLQRHDLIVAPSTLGMPGRCQPVFRDRFVCVASAGNPAVQLGAVSFQELAELPYATSSPGETMLLAPDLALVEAGVTPRTVVRVRGLLTLAIAISGSDLVGFIPASLYERCAGPLDLRTVDHPLQVRPHLEVAYWHPDNAGKAAVRWLLDIFSHITAESPARHRPDADAVAASIAP